MEANTDDYEIVSLSRKKFKSLPLFLPNNVKYDPKTNSVTTKEGGSFDDEQEDHHLALVPDAGFDLLKSVRKPLGCVSCVGPYRTGKSLLLSRFLRDSKSFQVGPTLEGCTKGIWISTSAVAQKDEHGKEFYTFLLDCEGAGDPLEGDDASNARIALTCILISGMFMFNNTGRPDRGGLQFLSYLGLIRKRIPDHDERPFPSFLWVFRDFFLQLPNRKDTGEPYTLKDYMLERVLVKSRGRDGGENEVVDSLLGDFSSFNVMNIGYPRRGDEPFTAEELCTLDEIDWSEFGGEFQNDVERVVSFCLKEVSPFRLGGAPAKGKQFASWCKEVLDLVNSDDILPNIPDVQERLMQSLADDAVEKATASYSQTMWGYLDACPVFQDNAQTDGLSLEGLKGVADETDLAAKSQEIFQLLEQDYLAYEIVDESLLQSSTEKLIAQCIKDPTSIYAQCQQENSARSQVSCSRLAHYLYDGYRKEIRADATDISIDDFQAKVADIEASFRKTARGPNVTQVVENFLHEQRDGDRVFLEKVHGINDLYKETLELKHKLDEDVEKKTDMILNLEKNMEENAKKHKEEVETVLEQTKQDMEKLREEQQKALEVAIAEQKAIEASRLAELTAKMDEQIEAAEKLRTEQLQKKREEMEALKKENETRLAEEIKAREERMKKEEDSHQEEINRLMAMADEKMKAEIVAGEEKRKSEQVQFRADMDKALKEAEDHMNEEVQKREAQLKLEEEKHNEEVQRIKKEMHDRMQEELNLVEARLQEEKEKHEQEVQKLAEKCNFGTCTIS